MLVLPEGKWFGQWICKRSIAMFCIIVDTVVQSWQDVPPMPAIPLLKKTKKHVSSIQNLIHSFLVGGFNPSEKY